MTAPPISYRRELTRKAIHLTSLVVPLAYALGMSRRTLLATLAALALLAVAVEIGRARSAPVRATFERLFDPLLRDEERRAWCGATWMLLSFLAAVALFPPAAAIAAMWAVAAGDAMAAIVGRAVGRLRPGRSGKSLEGSMACAVVTYAGAVGVARLDPVAAALAATVAAAAEWPSRPLDDNLRITILTGVAVTLWHTAFLDKFPG